MNLKANSKGAHLKWRVQSEWIARSVRVSVTIKHKKVLKKTAK